MYRFFGGLAQLGERNAGSVEVRGSSPLFSIYEKPLCIKGFSLISKDKDKTITHTFYITVFMFIIESTKMLYIDLLKGLDMEISTLSVY